MSPEDRQLIRELIDTRRRQLIADEAEREKTCAGCGADYSARTTGCRTCTDRHRDRTRGRPNRLCNECSCRYHERTTGCHTCTERHRYRRKRTRWAAA